MKTSRKPPYLPLQFLRWFCHEDLLEDVEGDVLELFYQRNRSKRASLLFYKDVLLLFRPGIIKNFKPFSHKINYDMLFNYLKIARRLAIKYKGYTFLNLLGLVVGIWSSMLIFLWVQDELNMDQFHAKGNNIYQVFRNMKQSDYEVTTTASIPKPAATLLNEKYSEVDKVALLSWSMESKFSINTKSYNFEGRFASPEFFDMFTFPLLVGDKKEVLSDIKSIVISKRMAQSLFGKNWRSEAINQTVTFNGEISLNVSGIFEDAKSNSTLAFDWIMPAEAYIANNSWVNDWGNGSFRVYFTTANQEKARTIATRLRNEIKTHTQNNNNAGDEELIIQKFEDTYLYSNYTNGVVDGGRINYVRIMIVVLIALLVIASINFMNLTTARAARRKKEVGVRKVLGSRYASLSFQFLTEATFLVSIAAAIAVGLVYLTLPFFNQLVNKTLFIPFGQPEFYLIFLSAVVAIGLVSGSYPAFIIPALKTIDSLRNKEVTRSGSSLFRKSLVVFQFTISTILLIGTIVVYQQIQFVLNKNIGLNKENLVAIHLATGPSDKLEAYKTELLKSSSIIAVSANSGNPVNYGLSTSSASWEGKDSNKNFEINIMVTDQDFIQTMEMKMVEGRAFDPSFNDSTNFIINETAASVMGFDKPVGKKVSFWGINGQIIGVVKNFHMRSMHESIAPLIITCNDPTNSQVVMVRLGNDLTHGLEVIDNVTAKVYPDTDFDYEFIETALEQSYEGEITARTLVSIFAGISILVSCLGLIGLTAYSAEQRSKEVGIRKVHGASASQLILLLSKEYLILISVALVIAIPLGYYIMSYWLRDFEFRMNMGIEIFVLAGLATLIMALASIITRLYQSTHKNPVESLKAE